MNYIKSTRIFPKTVSETSIIGRDGNLGYLINLQWYEEKEVYSQIRIREEKSSFEDNRQLEIPYLKIL
ncbi:hypothetical protein [Treponema primitia]|uniref:hypothetical protein n=1 Tax=Treponema primitia TaxID=88058 RepID=UPI00025558BF|nr:hypothetical protein [Treponema primitia]